VAHLVFSLELDVACRLESWTTLGFYIWVSWSPSNISDPLLTKLFDLTGGLKLHILMILFSVMSAREALQPDKTAIQF